MSDQPIKLPPEMRVNVRIDRCSSGHWFVLGLEGEPNANCPVCRLSWRSIQDAPKDGTRILLAKIVGHPDHDTALWWAVAGHWSAKWNNWNDGVEPCGLAGPTHWLELPSIKHLAPGCDDCGTAVERGSLIDERCAKCGRELLEPVERKPGTDGTICCGCALKD